MFSQDWGHYVCGVVGGFVFVRCHESNVDRGQVFVFDINQRRWDVQEFRGQAPRALRGNSLTTVNDALLFVGNEPRRFGYLDVVFTADLPLKEWRRHRVLGDEFVVARGHTAVYWEFTHSVIINTARKRIEPVSTNRTYVLRVDTLSVKLLETKGHAPTHRKNHSALFMDSQQKMFIAGGLTLRSPRRLLGDMYILSLSTGVLPTWSQPELDSRLTSGFQRASMLMLGSYVLIMGGSRSGVPGTEVVAVCTSDSRLHHRMINQSGDTPNSESFRKCIILHPSEKRLLLIPQEPSEEGVRCFQARYTPRRNGRKRSRKQDRKRRRTMVEGRKSGAVYSPRARATPSVYKHRT